MKAAAARSAPLWPLVLAFFLLLGLALTWPLATRLASDLPGGPHKDGLEDAYQNVWNLWWTVEALRRPTNLWVTDRLFHPDGPNLLFHTLSPANTLLAAPVTAHWGPVAGFNAVALASFALGGLGMWLLARRRTGPGPALLAGIVYVASPFHMAALVTDGQLQIFAQHWLPWYIYCLLEALNEADPPRMRGRALRMAALAGLLLVLTAWTDWYYTLFLLIFTACAAAWRLWRARGAGLAALTARLAVTGAVFTLGAAPLVGPMLVEAARADYMRILPPDDPARLSADLLAYLVPPRLHALWGAAPWDWGVGFAVNRRFFVGAGVAALAAVALWRRPAARPWGLAALGFGVLSLGATLRINGADTGLPLPYALLADLPIIRLTRQPDRFNVLVTIALGVLVAYGAAALVERTTANGSKAGAQRFRPGAATGHQPVRPASAPPARRTAEAGRLAAGAQGRSEPVGRQSPAAVARRSSLVGVRPVPSAARPWLMLALLGALILLEYWPAPIVTRTPAVPPFLAALPPGAGALVEYPFHSAVTYRDAERMLFQTRHGRPISGGYHSRAYPQPQLGLPALRDLRAGRLTSDIAREPGGWPAALRTLGYSHIIGYKQQPLGPISLAPADEASFRALVEAGLGVSAPYYEDEWLIAYAVPAAAPAPVVQIRDGWGLVEEAAPGVRQRWLPTAAELGLIVPTAGPYRLSFGAMPAGGPRTLQVAGPDGVTRLALASAARRYSLLLQLPAGRTVLRLSTVEPPTTGQALEGNGDLRPITVRFADVGLEPLAHED